MQSVVAAHRVAAMMRGPLLTALRDATSGEHRAVEAMLPMNWSTLERADYAAHLSKLAGFHVPMEQRLFAAHDWEALGLPEASARQRTALLARDLRALGLDLAHVPRCPEHHLPDIHPEAKALGALYVLEGSTLGGRVLARQVRAAFGDGAPTAFFGDADETSGRRWKSFCAFSEARTARDGQAVLQAAATAVETFRALRCWLGDK